MSPRRRACSLARLMRKRTSPPTLPCSFSTVTETDTFCRRSGLKAAPRPTSCRKAGWKLSCARRTRPPHKRPCSPRLSNWWAKRGRGGNSGKVPSPRPFLTKNLPELDRERLGEEYHSTGSCNASRRFERRSRERNLSQQSGLETRTIYRESESGA